MDRVFVYTGAISHIKQANLLLVHLYKETPHKRVAVLRNLQIDKLPQDNTITAVTITAIIATTAQRPRTLIFAYARCASVIYPPARP